MIYFLLKQLYVFLYVQKPFLLQYMPIVLHYTYNIPEFYDPEMFKQMWLHVDHKDIYVYYFICSKDQG